MSIAGTDFRGAIDFANFFRFLLSVPFTFGLAKGCMVLLVVSWIRLFAPRVAQIFAIRSHVMLFPVSSKIITLFCFNL